MKPIRFIPDNTTFRFIRYRWPFFCVSIALMLGTFALLATKGLNYGIDFTGGLLVEIRTEQPADIGAIRGMLSGHPELGAVELQHIGNSGDLMIRLQGMDEDRSKTINTLKTLLDEKLGKVDYRRTEYVGPQVGKELIRAAIISMALSCLAIMLYVGMRFEWQYGVGAILALAHDAILTVGFFCLMGLEFNLTSVAAILTVIGYSINDSVVIYDRVRENLRKYKKKPLEEVLDLSINDTLARTVMTGGSTLLSLIALIWLGGEVIMGFSLAMFFGVVIGTYSSIYVGTTVLIFFNLRPGKTAETATA